jgi:effector-binding domain-containing protein
VLYEVRQETVGEVPTAVVAATTSWAELPNAWPAMLGEVYDCLDQLGLGKAGRNVMFYKDDVPNLEVGVEVSKPFTPLGRVKLSALPGGNVATTIHRGPYQGLSGAHQAVHDWCRASGLTVTGPRWEVYGHIRDGVEPETSVSWLLE